MRLAPVLQEEASPRLEPIRRKAALLLAVVGDACRLSLKVHDDAVRHVVHLPAGLLRAEAEVDFLEVEKEAFVEEPDLVEHFSSEHHSRAGDPVHGHRLVPELQQQLPVVQELGERTELEAFDQLAPGARKPKRRLRLPAVPVLDPGTGNSDVRPALHEREQGADGTLSHVGIRIDEHHVLGRVLPFEVRLHAGVVARAITSVAGLRHQGAPIPAVRLDGASDDLDRIVSGVVFGDNNSHVADLIHLVLQGPQTANRQLGRPVVHCDDEDFHLHSIIENPSAVGKTGRRSTRSRSPGQPPDTSVAGRSRSSRCRPLSSPEA